jgi:hypothetical protein
MKKVFLGVLLVMASVPVFSFGVSSDELTSRYGVSYSERQKSDYIEKDGYSFRYIGNGKWDAQSLSSGSSVDSRMVWLIIIGSIAHIILTYCVYKMKGQYWACFYFFLAPVAILGIVLYFSSKSGVGGYKPNHNDITVTHKHERW